MPPKIEELIGRIRQLEDEVEVELQQRRARLGADFEQRKVRFEAEVLARQRSFKAGLLHYLLTARAGHVLTAPVVYGVLPALLLVDLFVTLYQWICFPLYRIPRVRRRDYLVFDRGHLAYLNAVEKINCIYCSYGNGLASYLKEIIGRTEQYWCPIKHARRIRQAHGRYSDFADFGDAEGFRRELEALRERLSRLG